MFKLSCFLGLGGKKNVNVKKSVNTIIVNNELNECKTGSLSVVVPSSMQMNNKVKVLSHDSPIGVHDDTVSMKRDFSDYDLQARLVKSKEDKVSCKSFNNGLSDQFDNKTTDDVDDADDIIQSGHVSDPGTITAEFWASPKLKRSCSNLETRDVLKKFDDELLLSNSQSFEEMQKLAKRMSDNLPGNLSSPISVLSQCSADKVMLKKYSSSQILPSSSRKLWWNLFLWSHRNIHDPWAGKQLPVKSVLNQQGGYSSDTVEPKRDAKDGSPISFTFKEGKNTKDNPSWDKFQTGLWPQNQWLAFSTESSSLTRVDEWVHENTNEPPFIVVNDCLTEDAIIFPPSPDNGKSPERSTSQSTRHHDMILPEHIVHANNVVRSLNSSSTVAHISGIGLKVIPALWRFSSLRSINLQANYIVHIAPGSLPKGLHTLNLSRNKISTIEGLKELTRLRVLDLSCNQISRIGQGLSNCTLIKELYLAGNKVSDVEGLHRLLKLTILDMSFNKITTTKALGQIVANYNSLLALNLLGNPIQNNVSDDLLRKAVCSLAPKLAYLNKQPINTQMARELAAESIAKAAVGSSDRGSRRRAGKKVRSQGTSSSLSGHRNIVSASHQKSRLRSKTRTYQNSPLKTKYTVATSKH